MLTSPALASPLLILLASGALLHCASSRAADIRFFGITKGTYHVQNGTGAPLPAAGNAFEFHAFAELNNPGSLASATLKWPRNGAVKTLTNFVHSWHLQEFWPSQENMNFGAPNGTYQFAILSTGDGSKTPSLTLSADFYPLAPHVANYAAAQEIDWRNDFSLVWQANSADFTYVRVMEGSEVVFQTGSHPGAPGALPARANSVLIPRNTLQEGSVYHVRISPWVRASSDTTTIPGATGWAAYKRTTDLVIRTIFAANDLHWYGVYKKQNFQQTGPGAPVPATQAPFEVAGFAEAQTPPGMSLASLKFPNNAQKNLAGLGTAWRWSESFPTQQAMDAAYPNGNCDFSLTTLLNGVRQASLALTGNAWPSQPHISNWYEANLIQPAQPFALHWHLVPGATADDFIQVRVTRNGEVLFQSGHHPRAPGALNGLATSVVLPAGILGAGETAEASILYFRPSQIDTFSYPRTLGVAGYARETKALLRARGGNFPQPRLAKVQKNGTQMALRIEAADPGRVYEIERSTDLRNWTRVLQTNAPETAFDLHLNHQPQSGPLFFRTLVY